MARVAVIIRGLGTYLPVILNLQRSLSAMALSAPVLALLVLRAQAIEDPLAKFQKEVLPILEERCFECHGPEKQKGGLRLDHKSGMLAGGDSEEPAIVPGKSADSSVIKRIASTDPDETMPPKGARLKPEQVALLKQWIDRGAHWPNSEDADAASPIGKGMVVGERDREFWAFQLPKRSAPTCANGSEWVRQPLDAFILARLQARGLEPSGRGITPGLYPAGDVRSYRVAADAG